MTMRERILAVVRGLPHDRVPFVQYDGCAAPTPEVWRVVGRDRIGALRWSAVHRYEAPHCRFVSEPIERAGRPGWRTVLHTPAGDLVEERITEPVYGSSAVHAHYVREPAHYHALVAYLEDLVVVDDSERYRRDGAELGDDGVPHVAVDRTPYQQLWVQWVSLIDLSEHLADCPDLVERCMSAMRRALRQQFELVRRARPPYVVVPDNITAPAIGVRGFERWCVPLYDELAEILEEPGVPVFVHMDGDLRPLWGAIGRSRVSGIDSLSPPPDNDTSVSDAARLWPRMRLCPNFPSSVHLRPPAEVKRVAQEMLEGAGRSGRLMIQISENVPPDRWRETLPAIAEAVEEHGGPLGEGA